MGDYNIPIIEPAIDYTKVPPINQKRTIAFINHFIIHTVTFLNKFALSCEEKLFQFENKLQRVEASLELLESRLSSISRLENEKNCSSEVHEKPREHEKENEIPESVDEIDESSSLITETQKEEIKKLEISDDSKYQKFFKMLHFGVPKPAVKLKMQQEGFDPSILDNPMEQVP